MSERQGPAGGDDLAGRGAAPDPEQEATAAVAPDAGAEEAAPVRDALDEELDDVLRSAQEPDDVLRSAEEPDGSVFTDAVTLAAERDEYLLALQRLQADFENYRKRVLRQQEEQTDRAALDLVGKLLPVLDVLDLAEAHLGTAPEEPEVAAEAKALTGARAMLLESLAKEGLERLDAPGVEFDPVVHDAVAHAPAADGEEAGVIDEVLRSGYRWRGRVLRPAMVRVRG